MKETKRATIVWSSGLVFKGGEPGGPQTVVDGDNIAAPGPMLTLLLAAASCTGSDVVSILEKMRVTVQEVRIEVAGERREEEPRRYTSIRLDYHLRGEGLDEARASRAIELSVNKYCSVLHSLAPDIAITHGFTLG
ncbi:MAG TPA: OsmC family protein [Gemmatimonadales bacterium]|jgi:putative redox protein